MADPLPAHEVEGVLWCVTHGGFADAARTDCYLAHWPAGTDQECDFRRVFIDPRPEAQVQR